MRLQSLIVSLTLLGLGVSGLAIPGTFQYLALVQKTNK